MLLLLLACTHPTPTSGFGAPDARIPLDPGVSTGVLPNGLTWYVQPNAYPDARAELRLVVSVGSVVEDDDQRGLAHVLEHMAFNGSAHFPEGELVAWFESVGMQFGAHLNAYTSFDETVYKVSVPTQDPATVDKGLLVLRDWADGMTLADAAIERERGVVLEEWRSGLGAGDRIFRALVPFQFHGSRYAERLPIGTEASLRGFTPDALRRFYKDWYRPDQMAVVAIGDFDPATLSSAIAARFGDIAAPPAPRARPAFDVPAHAETLVAVVSDVEIPTGGVSLTVKIDDPQRPTYDGYRDGLVTGLLTQVLNERFSTLGRDPKGALLGGGAGYQRLSATEASWSVGAGVRGNDPLPTLRAMLTEVERMRRFGPTDAEIDRARARMLQSFEQSERERQQETSDHATEELIRAFLHDESVPGTVAEADMARAWLPAIGRDELVKAATSWLPAESRVVELVLPDGPKPTEDAVRAVLAEVAAATIAPPAAEAAQGPLLDPLPKPGTVAKRGAVPELEITTWTLSNGVEVWVKPTKFKAGEVLLGSWSPGGRAMADDATWISARAAEELRARSGLGTFSAPALEKRLSGIEASSGGDLGRFEESVSGSGSAGQLETMLQLVNLQFTAPRFDADAFEAYRTEKAQRLPKRANSPDNVFADAWDAAMWQSHPRMLAWTMADLDHLQLGVAQAFWTQRFANAADFRFFIVGDVDLATLEPLVARYLGSLPANTTRETARDDGPRRAPGQVVRTIHAGTEPKARFRMAFHGAFEGGWLARNRLQALADILQVRLREQLREEMGGVYGVGVSQSTSDLPVREYTVQVDFGCDPARLPELRAAVQATIEELKTTSLPDRYIEAEKEINRRKREVDLVRNGFWRSSVLATIERGEDPRDLLTYDARNESLTPAELQLAAKKWLDPTNVVQLEMLPVEAK